MNRKLFLHIGLLLLTFSSFAQEQDFQIWTEVSAEAKLNKKFSIQATEELRFDKNASRLDKWHNTIGAEYAFSKNLKVSASYRFTQNNTLKRGFVDAHRFYVDGAYKYKVKRFILHYRLRYQADYATLDKFVFDGQMIRNRLKVKYNIRKTPLMPFVSYELFYNLGSRYGSSIERHRFTGGFDYDFNDNISGGIFYRYQTTSGYFIEANNTYILGASVSINF